MIKMLLQYYDEGNWYLGCYVAGFTKVVDELVAFHEFAVHICALEGEYKLWRAVTDSMRLK